MADKIFDRNFGYKIILKW